MNPKLMQWLDNIVGYGLDRTAKLSIDLLYSVDCTTHR